MYVILKENDVNKLSNGTITLIGKPNEVTVYAVYVGFFVPNTNNFYVHMTFDNDKNSHTAPLTKAENLVSYLNGGVKN